MSMWIIACLALAACGVLGVVCARQADAITELKATGIVNAGLVGELERKLGPRKAARIVRSGMTTVRQTLATKGV